MSCVIVFSKRLFSLLFTVADTPPCRFAAFPPLRGGLFTLFCTGQQKLDTKLKKFDIKIES